jgi:hypothetical protein
MVEYTLHLAIRNSETNNSITHTLKLPPDLENNPDRLFDLPFSTKLRAVLQQKSNCAINNAQLDRIITTWREDIREGYRTTSLSLDLPPLEFENIHQLQDTGDRTIPPLFPPDLSEIEPQGGALPPLTFS